MSSVKQNVALQLATGQMPSSVHIAQFLDEVGCSAAASVARERATRKLEGPSPNMYDRLSAGESENAVIPEGATGTLTARTAREIASERQPSRSDLVRRGVETHYNNKDALDRRHRG